MFYKDLFNYNYLANPLNSKRTSDKQFGRINWKRCGFHKTLFGLSKYD